MPSREEIVEVLKTYAELFDDCTNLESPGNSMRTLAAQVAAMRCVDCAKSKGPSVDGNTFCYKFYVVFPHEHGCFSYEQKPAG